MYPHFYNIIQACINIASDLGFDAQPYQDVKDSNLYFDLHIESFQVKPTECRKWMMVMIVSNYLGISKDSKDSKLLLYKAVIDIESYNAGYVFLSTQPKTLLTW